VTTPFDSIESAHQYVTLLREEVQRVAAGISDDITAAEQSNVPRRVDALRLVDYKLAQLTTHLSASGRILNDLRALRRLLLPER
jgi:hypothetical protein